MKYRLIVRVGEIFSKSPSKVLMRKGETFIMDNGESQCRVPSIDRVSAVITAMYGAEPNFGFCNGTETFFDVKCLFKN